MSSTRQRGSSGAHLAEHLTPIPEQTSFSGDTQRSARSLRSDARSSRSHSRSSAMESRSPRSEIGGSTNNDKANDDFHEKTKEALGNLIVRKDELESKGIETEMMYKELMNCVSPWRRKKLKQEAEESQSALEDALRSADELMIQANSAFKAYQSMHDPKRKEAAAGDLFWKSKVMHKTLTACVQVACNAESARDQLAWADKMGKIMNSMMAIFRIMDELKQNLSKERALTKSLTNMMQRYGYDGLLDPKDMDGCGDEMDLAMLLARADASSRKAPEATMLTRLLQQRIPRPLLAALTGLLAAGLLWATLAPELAPAELAQALLTALGLAQGAEPGLWETIQLWTASLVYGVLGWVPGICSSGQPVTAASLWSLGEKLCPI